MNARLGALLALAAGLCSACGTDEPVNLNRTGGIAGQSGSSSGGNGGQGGFGGGGGNGGSSQGGSSGNGPLALDFEGIDLDQGADLVTDFTFIPDTNPPELIAVAKDGQVYHYELDDDETTLLGKFQAPEVFDETDCGMLSITLDPEFDTNGFIYLGTCTKLTENAIFRFTFDAGDYSSIPDSSVDIIRVAEPRANRPWHNVGTIGFEPDGETMWALFGEKVVQSQAENTTNNLGSLVRIKPNREAGGSGYEPAEGNAFDDGVNSPDIYAYGLRSPWKGTLDSQGRYWVGDVGSSNFEEINIVTAAGQNLGWGAEVEGPCDSETHDCSLYRDPATYWNRSLEHPYVLDDADAFPVNARVAWVAPEYLPNSADPYRGRLDNRVMFGEYCVGFVRMGEADDEGALVVDQHLGHLDTPGQWRQGPDGYMYAITFGRCQTDIERPQDTASRLYRAVPVGG